jgi:tetratricopeptide (TPR) repeat protein
MDRSVLTSVIEIEGKNYTLETFPEAGRNRISSSVQSQGRVLSLRALEMPEGLSEEGLKNLLQDTHRIRSVELESLFRLSRKIEEKPTADACWKIGVIFLCNGFYEDARHKFMKAIELSPEHFQALKNYGITLMLLEDHDGAIAALSRAKEMGATFADVHYHLGSAYLYKRDLDESVKCYLQALQINPRYADARLRLATNCVGYLVQAGDSLSEAKCVELMERAGSEASTAANLNPRIRNRAFLMAQDYLKSRKFIMAFQNFLEARPRYVPRIGDESWPSKISWKRGPATCRGSATRSFTSSISRCFTVRKGSISA